MAADTTPGQPGNGDADEEKKEKRLRRILTIAGTSAGVISVVLQLWELLNGSSPV